jgi:hypothetical protein
MSARDKVKALVDEYGVYYLVHQIAGVIADETTTMALEGKVHGPKYVKLTNQFEVLSKALKKL